MVHTLSMTSLAALLLLSVLSLVMGDLGYEKLYEDALEEYDEPTERLQFNGTIPSFVRGKFVQVGPGQWCWNSKDQRRRCVTHILDGFSKLHSLDFKDDGSVAFTSKFLQSGMRAESIAQDDIAFNVMAQPTVPPFNMSMSTFINAPNDNNNVNVYQTGNDTLAALSDTCTVLEFDMHTLNTTHEHNSMDCHTQAGPPCTKINHLDTPLAQLGVGGTAHPYKLRNGDYLALLETGKVAQIMPGDESMRVYRMAADDMSDIHEIVKIPTKRSSYAHSFGLVLDEADEEKHHVIVVEQPLHYDLMNLVKTGTLQSAFKNEPDEITRFYVAPLEDDAEVVAIDGPRFFFGHVMNSFSAGKQFVIDIDIQDGIFFSRYSLDVQLNKTARDSWTKQVSAVDGKAPGYNTPTRFTLDPANKTVTSKPLWGVGVQENIDNEHDLFKLHPDDYGLPYCGYWAQQVFYKSSSFASWAVVRAEICGDKPVVAAAWYRPNVYPGEASFVPTPGSSDKTDGVLLFKALDGNTGKSLFIVANASTMETMAEAELPVHVPFTVHGQFFPTHDHTKATAA